MVLLFRVRNTSFVLVFASCVPPAKEYVVEQVKVDRCRCLVFSMNKKLLCALIQMHSENATYLNQLNYQEFIQKMNFIDLV